MRRPRRKQSMRNFFMKNSGEGEERRVVVAMVVSRKKDAPNTTAYHMLSAPLPMVGSVGEMVHTAGHRGWHPPKLGGKTTKNWPVWLCRQQPWLVMGIHQPCFGTCIKVVPLHSCWNLHSQPPPYLAHGNTHLEGTSLNRESLKGESLSMDNWAQGIKLLIGSCKT